MKLRKGDIVGRKSYGKDIVFVISNIIKYRGQEIAILKGLITRIEADSPIEDLELMEEYKVIQLLNKFEAELERIKKNLLIKTNIPLKRTKEDYGKILHLDGDKKYSEKSQRFYKNIGLDVIVKNIPENKQPQIITNLLNRYNPDILVVTGHDRNDKKRIQL